MNSDKLSGVRPHTEPLFICHLFVSGMVKGAAAAAAVSVDFAEIELSPMAVVERSATPVPNLCQIDVIVSELRRRVSCSRVSSGDDRCEAIPESQAIVGGILLQGFVF